MASQIEQDILADSGMTIDGLRRAIRARHDAGEKIAAPHEPLLAAAQGARNVPGAFAEVVRGHLYAPYLEGDKLAENWTFFIQQVQRY